MFAGLVLGIFLCAVVCELAGSRVCPEKVCVGEAEVIPVSDRGYFPVVHKALQSAKSSIHIASFELKYYESYPGSLENVIIDDLVKAHERGVDVRIIIDQYADQDEKTNAYGFLLGKGLKIKYDSNKTTTHAKLIIIDGRVVVLGSTNFSYYALEKNREVDLLVESAKIAGYFEDYFEALWKENA